MDQSGRLVDCRLGERRDLSAAKQFFKEALEMSGDAPDRVTTDKEVSYPRAIREDLGGNVLHRTNQYLNNLIEQDHRGIKLRTDVWLFYLFATLLNSFRFVYYIPFHFVYHI